MTTAAEALEKLIRLERDLEKKCHDLGYYNMIHVGLREFVEHAATLRAALAAPQPDEARILREFDGAIAAARLLGATDATRGFGCYTEEDARSRRAWHESIASHRRRAAAYLARTGGKEE